MTPHPPEVLRDLCARLRRQPAPPPDLAPTWSGNVYELERDEIAAAHHFGVLVADPHATVSLGLQAAAAPATEYHSARGPHKTFIRRAP